MLSIDLERGRGGQEKPGEGDAGRGARGGFYRGSTTGRARSWRPSLPRPPVIAGPRQEWKGVREEGCKGRGSGVVIAQIDLRVEAGRKWRGRAAMAGFELGRLCVL